MNNIIDLWNKTVKNCPNSIAVEQEDQKYTYEDLDELSNKYATVLNTYKKIENELFAVYSNKSVNYVACVLGIWKIGAAVLPLDANLPTERINNILKSANIHNLVVESINKNINAENVIVFQKINNVKQVLLPKEKCSSNATAYVIYTSGSTGKPKGVEIGMDSLVNFLNGILTAIPLTSKDRFLSITTISFDISIMEIFLPFIVGATVILGSHRTQIDIELLKRTILKKRITIMQATPITWELLVSTKWKNETGITILCGGDKISGELSLKLFDLTDKFYCLYGPTETTIWASVLKVKNKLPVSLGNPLPNIDFCVLDKNYNIASKGELFIKGKCLAKGYYKNDVLTKENFIKIRNLGNGKFYKTGDIVKRINGKLFFLGRADQQVKINGFRVELGEIEKAAESISCIKKAAAILDNNSKALYLFLISSTAISKEAILARLKQTLPTYMLPSRIINVENFALTFNNKVDRKQTLQRFLDKQLNLNNNEFSCSDEKILNDVKKAWKTILNIDHINNNTSYDQIGISSIDIIEICTKLSELGYTISFTDFIKLKTISKIAKYISKKKSNQIDENLFHKYKLNSKTDKIFHLTSLQEKMLMDFYINSKNRNYIEKYKIIIDRKGKSLRKVLDAINKQITVTPVLHTKFYFRKRGQSIGVFSPTISTSKIIVKKQSSNKFSELNLEDELNINDINKQSINIGIGYNSKKIYLEFVFHHVRLDMFSFYDFLYEILRRINIQSIQKTRKEKEVKVKREYFLQQGDLIDIKDFNKICRFCDNNNLRISNFLQYSILYMISKTINNNSSFKFGSVYRIWNQNKFKLGNNIEVRNYAVNLNNLDLNNFETMLSETEIDGMSNNLLFTFNYVQKMKCKFDKLFNSENLQIMYFGKNGYKNNIIVNIYNTKAYIKYTGESNLIKEALININTCIRKVMKIASK